MAEEAGSSLASQGQCESDQVESESQGNVSLDQVESESR